MTDLHIEQDALASTPAAPEPEMHTHEEMKTFIATPRFDPSLMERMVGLFKARDKPGVHVVHKGTDALRLMVVVTSNSYMDREGETITSKALQDYEDSCYPGEDLFHCDNPLLWWHDDDIVMGEAVAVNYSEPFLIEVFRELSTRTSKVLFDFAEGNGDSAGASHRFGYLEKDRDPDGTFHRIFKQETSYLPQRDLAANTGTYAGVIGMASPQSDKKINEVFEPLGVKDAAAKFHAKTGAIEKELEALGIGHKAAKPSFPPQSASDTSTPLPNAPLETDAEDDMTEEDEEKDELVSEGGKIDLTRLTILLNGVLDMMDAQMQAAASSEMDRVGMMKAQGEMMKALDDIKEIRMSEKAAEKVTLDMLMEKMKALEARQAAAEKRLDLAPRRVAEQPPLDPAKLAQVAEDAKKAYAKGEVQKDPLFGVDVNPKLSPYQSQE